jgi:HD-GYP domain-containing protein (c-di-GMP phosphodiesterase class II)
MPTPHEALAVFAARAANLGAIAFDPDADRTLAPASPLLEAAVAAIASTPSPHLRCVDYTIAGIPVRVLLLEPDWLDSPALAEVARATGHNLWGLRAALKPHAAFPGPAALIATRALTDLAQDLSERVNTHAEHESTIASFTDELTKSYETLSLLYSIGSGLTDLSHPERFLQAAADRLETGSDFSHIAIRFVPPHQSPANDARPADPIIHSSRDASRLPKALALTARLPGDFTRFLDGKRVISPHSPTTHHDRQVLVQPIVLDGAFQGYLVGTDKVGTDPLLSSYDIQLFQSTASFLAAFLQTCRLFEQQRQMFLGTIKALTASIDAKDRYTRGHSERVAWLSASLARALGHSEQSIRRIHIAGLVHDVGKIGVPEAVLCKPGRLTDEEFGWIKKHPEIGHRILADIPQLADILPGVLHHHERIDGKGYPHGLAGDSIPEMARIIAVADTFDALSSTRSYRAARTRDVVLAEIARSSGTQLDPRVTAALASVDLTEFDRLIAEHASTAPAVAITSAA